MNGTALSVAHVWSGGSGTVAIATIAHMVLHVRAAIAGEETGPKVLNSMS